MKKRPGVNESSKRERRSVRLQEQRNVLASRIDAMVAGAKERITNTRRMIAQSRTLLGKAREALESSRVLRQTETVRPAAETKS